MKSITIIATALISAAVGFASISCSKENPESPAVNPDDSTGQGTVTDRISLSITSYTFEPEGESLNVEVQASGDWNYEGEAEWLTIEKNESGVVLTAAANETGDARNVDVVFVCGEASDTLYLDQLAGEIPDRFVDLDPNLYGTQTKFSLNSNYCVAYTKDENSNFVPILINTRTGEETRYEGSTDYSAVRAVSDDGRMISLTVGSIGCALLVDGQVTEIPCPFGYKTPVVSGFSVDGSVMVGYAQETDGYAYCPVKWTNMNPEVLEVPEYNVQGEEIFAGAMARACSADGSIVYGSEWDTWGFIYWDSEGMHYVADETKEMRTISYMGMELEMPAYFRKQAENYSISQNGRYIVGEFADYLSNGDGTYQAASVSYPGVYDTQTDELTIFEDLSGYDGLFVDNEGTVFAASFGVGYVIDQSGTSTTVDAWLSSQYGISTDSGRYILNISEDGRNIGGWRPQSNAAGQTLLYGWYYIQG